jgi:hypothetical protein
MGCLSQKRFGTLALTATGRRAREVLLKLKALGIVCRRLRRMRMAVPARRLRLQASLCSL